MKHLRAGFVLGLLFTSLAANAQNALSGVDLHLYSDLYYTYNMNSPSEQNAAATTGFGENGYYRYNNVNNSIELSDIGFSVSKKLADFSVFGQMDFGPQADAINGLGSGRHVSQLYFDFAAFNTWTLRVGKMFTHMGFETPYAKDNWNYSRSIGYAFGIPTWHVGAAMISPESRVLNTKFFIYNGIGNTAFTGVTDDGLHDNNHAKTLGAQVAFTPADNKNISVTYNGLVGPEKNDNNSDKTWIHNLVVQLNATQNMQFVGELIVGSTENDHAPNTAVTGTDTSRWKSIAAYMKYGFNDRLYVAPRVEVYKADQAAGQLGLVAAGTPTDESVKSLTVTVGQKIGSTLEARYEFRHDKSDNDNAYNNGGTDRTDSQNTFTAAMLLNW